MARVYLIARGIDEIEDHPTLDATNKIELLDGIDRRLRLSDWDLDLPSAVGLPEVTARLPEWLRLAPSPLTARIDDSMAVLASRMSYWVERNWVMDSLDDLLLYAYDVSGVPGIAAADVLAAYLGVEIDRRQSVRAVIAFQLAHIVRGREADLARGVDYYPRGWTDAEMRREATARQHDIHAMLERLPPGPVRNLWRTFLLRPL